MQMTLWFLWFGTGREGLYSDGVEAGFMEFGLKTRSLTPSVKCIFICSCEDAPAPAPVLDEI